MLVWYKSDTFLDLSLTFDITLHPIPLILINLFTNNVVPDTVLIETDFYVN